MKKKWISLFAVILLLLIAGLALAAPAFPEIIPLPNGFAPEGVTAGYGPELFVGSLATGQIYRADLRTGEGEVVVDSPVYRHDRSGFDLEPLAVHLEPRTSTHDQIYLVSSMGVLAILTTGAESIHAHGEAIAPEELRIRPTVRCLSFVQILQRERLVATHAYPPSDHGRCR